MNLKIQVSVNKVYINFVILIKYIDIQHQELAVKKLITCFKFEWPVNTSTPNVFIAVGLTQHMFRYVVACFLQVSTCAVQKNLIKYVIKISENL